MSDYQTLLIGLVALAIVGTGAWVGVVLIRRDRVGPGIGAFLVCAVLAAVVTDGMAW